MIPCVVSCRIANRFKDQMYFTLRGKKANVFPQCESPNPELCICWTSPLPPTKPSLEWFAPEFSRLACLWHRGVATKAEWFSGVGGWSPDVWNDRECTLGWLCVYSLLEPSCDDALYVVYGAFWVELQTVVRKDCPQKLSCFLFSRLQDIFAV